MEKHVRKGSKGSADCHRAKESIFDQMHLSGRAKVIWQKMGLVGIFYIFWSVPEAVKETGPHTRSPSRDLHFGSKKSQNHLNKRSQNRRTVSKGTF